MLSTHLPKSARNDLSVEPQKLYPEMFEAIQDGNWSKLSNAISLLMPFSAEVSETNKKEFNTKL